MNKVMHAIREVLAGTRQKTVDESGNTARRPTVPAKFRLTKAQRRAKRVRKAQRVARRANRRPA